MRNNIQDDNTNKNEEKKHQNLQKTMRGGHGNRNGPINDK